MLTCRERLLHIAETEYRTLFPDTAKAECIESIRFLLSKNIIHGNALTYQKCYRNGTLYILRGTQYYDTLGRRVAF